MWHGRCGLQGSPKETVEETIVFSLSMLHMVLSVAGPALAYDDALARLVQVELLAGMCQAVVSGHVCGARVCRWIDALAPHTVAVACASSKCLHRSHACFGSLSGLYLWPAALKRSGRGPCRSFIITGMLICGARPSPLHCRCSTTPSA